MADDGRLRPDLCRSVVKGADVRVSMKPMQTPR
jgi:hypothetical protein